jgi:hypothetical protein
MADWQIDRKESERDAELALIRSELWRLRERVHALEGQQSATDDRVTMFVQRLDALIGDLDLENDNG